MLDLVIRNGLIVDGSGLPGRHGDISIKGGKVVAVGGRAGEAHRVLDATGRVVAPGFIDPHTHYDAQLCFDPYAFPAIEHGITTVVPGNCSLSLAPLRHGTQRCVQPHVPPDRGDAGSSLRRRRRLALG